MWQPLCAARARSETRAPFFIGFFFFVQTPFETKAQLRVQRKRYGLHIVCAQHGRTGGGEARQITGITHFE